jgi:hypothetical protein
MGQSDEVILSVLDEISDLLRVLELRDSVICEKVNLNDYIPSLSGPAPMIRSRQGKKSLLNPEALQQSVRRGKMSQGDPPRLREKDTLIAKRAELENVIDQQTKKVAELEKEKARLEQQLTDLQTRARLGSRSQIGAEEFQTTHSDSTDNLNLTEEGWKEKYEEMEKKYKFLTDALAKRGPPNRVAPAGKPRQIPPPTVHIPTFEIRGPPEEGATF